MDKQKWVTPQQYVRIMVDEAQRFYEEQGKEVLELYEKQKKDFDLFGDSILITSSQARKIKKMLPLVLLHGRLNLYIRHARNEELASLKKASDLLYKRINQIADL